MPYQAPRGTQDVLPTESHRWQWLEREFLDLSLLYGYREIRTPVFEDEALFTRTSGETSDIVTKQMYNFVDKGGRDIALKPEGTAPIVRSVIEHNLCPTGTVSRLSYVTPIYRYERPQKGRLREAHQVGLELIGSSAVAADAEIIEVTVRFYERIGISDLVVKLNSLGRDQCRASFREAVLSHAAEYLAAQPEEYQEKSKKNPLRLLDSKDPEVQGLMANGPSVLDYLEDESKSHFAQLQKMLSDVGIGFEIDPSVVRGLDYYSDTVFEVQSTKLGAQSSLCGGGRYDGLVKELGGPPTPSIGVAMGIERALIVLEAEEKLPPLPSIRVFVASTGPETESVAREIAAQLRAEGISALIDIDAKSLKSQLRQADRSGVSTVLVVGEEELARGAVVVRDLATSEQQEIRRKDLLQAFGAPKK
jgi:histidyl-tRNA synthetase